MTVMPTQIVQTHQDHLLASVTIALTTMAMEKRAMLTVSLDFNSLSVIGLWKERWPMGLGFEPWIPFPESSGN